MQTSQTNTKTQDKDKKQAFSHSLIAAANSGLIGAYSTFIFEGTKKRLQSNQSLPNPFQLGPKAWFRESFRGSSSFAGSLVPTSVIQQVSSHYLADKNLSNSNSAKTMETVFCGSLGGLSSTVVENIVLEQQLKKASVQVACKQLLSEGPTRIFRGLPLIMVREAIFGFCYMKGAKQARDYATEHFGQSHAITAQLLVAALGSLASHPFDTTATTMQRYGYHKVQDAVTHLWKENKITAFYKGGAARVGLFAATMTCISKVQEFTIDQLEKLEHQP